MDASCFGERSAKLRPVDEVPLPKLYRDPPNAATVQEVTRWLKALAEPLRLRILYELRGGELTVGELVARMGCSQPNVSRHLTQLHRVGIITRRQQGKTVYYAVGSELALDICDRICGRVRAEVEQRHRLLGDDGSTAG